MFKLDKKIFVKHSAEDAQTYHQKFKTENFLQRLNEGYFLSLMVYGFTPEKQPTIDKACFTMKKQ